MSPKRNIRVTPGSQPAAMLTIRPIIQTAIKIRPNIAKKRLSLPVEPVGYFDVSISLDVLSVFIT